MGATTPHVHAECIKAWADGKPIEWFEGVFEQWRDIGSDNPMWNVNTLYRVKPDILRYRVALFRYSNGGYLTDTAADNGEDETDMQESEFFVRWITDWIEVEVC